MTGHQLAHADAASEGFDPARLRALDAAVGADIAAGAYDGARIVIGRRGRIVHDAALGYNSREHDRALGLGDVFSVMSLMKAWTAVMVLRHIEAGRLQLTTRVEDVIPGFGANGKRRINVAQLLSHTSGLGMGLPPVPVDQMGDLDANMAAILNLSPLSEPGKRVSHSASIGYTVLGDLIRRCDPAGRSYNRILAEDLFGPLGMTSTVAGCRADLQPRRVPIAMSSNEPNIFGGALLVRLNDLLTEDAQVPGGGGWSSGHDMFRFAEMMRCNGALGEARILSPAMVRLATTIHTGDLPNSLMTMMQEDNFIEEHPANLGLRFSVRGHGIHLTPFGTLASPSTFGALGIGSMVFWVDPQSEVTCVMLTAGLMGQFSNYHRFQRLSDMVHAAIVEP